MEGYEQAAESKSALGKAALGGEKKRKRQRAMEPVVESKSGER